MNKDFSRKRGVISLLPEQHPLISSKKQCCVHETIPSISSKIDIWKEIKQNFPYGCQYDVRRRMVSFFNEDYAYIGYQKEKKPYQVREKKDGFPFFYFYSISEKPIMSKERMQKYIQKLSIFKNYIEFEVLDIGSEKITFFHNTHYERIYCEKNILFGSDLSRKGIF